MRMLFFVYFLTALTNLPGIDESILSYNQLKNRLLTNTGYVRSFSGVRYKNMGLEPTIAFEDRAMAFVDGYAYGKFLLSSDPARTNFSCILAKDTRPTGDAILLEQTKGVLTAALEENKCIELINLGVATTPLWESAIREFKADGGIMITASHNPLNENGWKYADSYINGGSLLDPSQMAKVLSHSHDVIQLAIDHTIDLPKMMNGIHDAEDRMLPHLFHFERALNGYLREQETLLQGTDRNIVLINDCNGGSAARVNTLALARLGFKNVINLNTKLGVPAHKIEPIKGEVGEENDRNKNALIDVTKALQETGAKVAIVYDCDADRGNLVLLDDKNHVDEISPQDVAAFNVAMALLPYRHMKLDRNLAVVGHCATSGRTKEIASLLGAEFKTVEVGEINVAKKMRELTKQDYIVPIGVEGYNGGTIFQGSQCRDGLQTLLSAAKALSNPTLFYSWLDAKGEKSTDSDFKRISEGNFYLTDFINQLVRYTSLQEKKTGVQMNQKEFKISLEQAFADSITSFPASISGRIYQTITIEYISETEIRSRPFNTSFIPGEGLEGNFMEGGWRIRLTSAEGREATIWIRGSKTENGTYRTLADASSTDEATDLNNLLQGLFNQACTSNLFLHSP